MRRIRRDGRYYRVADPDWRDPLDGGFSRRHGGRWNAPGTFPVVYLNRDLITSRAYVRRKFEGQPFGPELLREDRAPVLVVTGIPATDYVDAVIDAGCRDLGLPVSYPRDRAGHVVPWTVCQPIGRGAWDDGELGIACRSAAVPAGVEELASFTRPAAARLPVIQRLAFAEWFWPAG